MVLTETLPAMSRGDAPPAPSAMPREAAVRPLADSSPLGPAPANGRDANGPTAGTPLDRVRAILPEVAARADEIERAAKVPLDLLDKLERAGAFRLCVPRMFGGEDLGQGRSRR